MKIYWLTVLTFFSIASVPPAGAGEHIWPDFHGPGRTNISPEHGLLSQWPKSGPRLLWSYDGCGRGYAGVVIAEGKVFTAGDVGKEERLLAFDMQGQLLWEVPNGQAWRRSSPGARSAPTYNEGLLYHLNPLGRLAAYKAQSGREVWAVDLGERFDVRYGIWGLSEHVVVEGDRVLCMPGASRGRVVALDKRTGATLWANTDIQHSAAYCSGTVVTHAGVRQFITLTQGSVVGLDIKTGELLWSAPFRPMSPQNALTPVYRDGTVFIACGHSSGGTLMKIDMANKTAQRIWYREDLDDCHSGAFVWEGKLFGTACRAGGKHFFCVDYLTGKTLQLDSTLGKVGMTCAEGKIYCMNHRGTLSLIDITAKGFDIVSQFELPKKPTNSYLAHPVVCGGRLYIRSHEDLFVYAIQDQ
jgi:outer membrane protein assembly factor BamB